MGCSATDHRESDDQAVKCSGWKGVGGDLIVELFDEHEGLNCPRCVARIELLMIVTEKDLSKRLPAAMPVHNETSSTSEIPSSSSI